MFYMFMQLVLMISLCQHNVGIEHCRGFYLILRGDDALGTNITTNNFAKGIDTLRASFSIENERETVTWANT